MRTIAVVLASTLLLGACTHNGLMGFEVNFSDGVNVMPVTNEVSESPFCERWRARKNWC